MDSDFRFSPLENGLDFLLSSLEYLALASALQPKAGELEVRQRWLQKRHLKYALLHLSSGIEVLFKERLRQEHWALVYKNPNKAKKDAHDRNDFESANFQEAMERLDGICGVHLSPEQRNKLSDFRDRRNQLEHFGTVGSLLAVSANVWQW